MNRQAQQPPFDFRRHFRELFRNFLPIFVVIGAVMIIVSVVFFAPGERTPGEDGDLYGDRVGLLSVDPEAPFDPAFAVIRPIERARAPRAVRFDAPMGSVHGALTYNAQPFLTSRHLGDDLNGIGGWDSDLGGPVYAAADGEVVYAGWPADGWGNVVIVLHKLTDGQEVETFYGHLDRIAVASGTEVRRGDRIGTVGKGDGRYLAHLHFEVRAPGVLDAGTGYADSKLGRLSGEAFLTENRGAAPDRQNGAVGDPDSEPQRPSTIRWESVRKEKADQEED